MERPVRRKDREITREEAMQLLESCEYGVLSVVDEDGAPYGIPLNYVLLENAIYFHCALQGRKTDCLAHEDRVSFCVVGATQPVFENDFSTNYESAVFSGKASLVQSPELHRAALRALCEKYLPQHMDKADHYIEKSGARTAVYRLSIEHIAGKARRSKPQ